MVLVIWTDAGWECATRYDCARGFAHRDVIGRRAGLLYKQSFAGLTRAEIFGHALHDFQKNTRPTPRSISRTERARLKPRAVTLRPLKTGDFTAEEFDQIAREHGARALTASEKRTFERIAAKRAH